MTFVKHRLPCHVCGSSDAVSENEDGSKWCFKCQRHVGEKNKASVGDPLPPQIKTLLDPSEAFYGAFPDRRIGSDTAQSLGVKTSGSTVLFNYSVSKFCNCKMNFHFNVFIYQHTTSLSYRFYYTYKNNKPY